MTQTWLVMLLQGQVKSHTDFMSCDWLCHLEMSSLPHFLIQYFRKCAGDFTQLQHFYKCTFSRALFFILILLFSKDALNWSILSSRNVFNINNKNITGINYILKYIKKLFCIVILFHNFTVYCTFDQINAALVSAHSKALTEYHWLQTVVW